MFGGHIGIEGDHGHQVECLADIWKYWLERQGATEILEKGNIVSKNHRIQSETEWSVLSNTEKKTREELKRAPQT